MSALSRTCLRLGAVAALRGQTLAGSNILDSGMGAIDAMKPEQRVPMISVYTEEDGGDALSEQNGGTIKEEVELVFDIAMVEAFFEADGTIIIGQPQTDAELEVALDLLEAQIHRSLFEDVTLPLSKAFRDSFLRVCRRESIRFRDEKSAERMAHRYLIYRVQVEDDALLVAYDPTLIGLARLPATFAKVAGQWPDGLNEKTIALALADQLAQPATQPLKGMDTIVAPLGMADAAETAMVDSPATVSAAQGNAGTGMLTLGSPPVLSGVQSGAYTISFSTPTTFVVSDPAGTIVGSGRVSVPFADQVGFTIAVGETAFAANDAFSIEVGPLLTTSWEFQP